MMAEEAQGTRVGDGPDVTVVRITLQDVYREQQANKDLLVALSASVDLLTQGQQRDIAQLRTETQDQENRLRRVEIWAAGLSFSSIGLMVTVATYLVQG